jgi:hypothetical protein
VAQAIFTVSVHHLQNIWMRSFDSDRGNMSACMYFATHFIVIFMSGLFNNTVSISKYVPLNDKMINE